MVLFYHLLCQSDRFCFCIAFSYTVKTTIIVEPQDLDLTPEYIEEFGEISFPCEAAADDSTPITITW